MNKKISNNLSSMQVDRSELNKSSVFEITIPHEFGLGKNEVKINLTSNSVKKGSEVLIDVNDATGEPIYYEISPIANVDKSRSVIIEIDSETIEGKASFILFSTLTSGQSYKCVLEIPVIVGIESNSEIKFETEPIIIYREKSLPTQTFSSTSRLINRTFVGGTISSIGSISPKQIQPDNLTIERPELTTRTKSNSVSGNVGSSSIQEIPSEFNLSMISGKNFAFSSSMKGGTIRVKNINLEIPKDASVSTPFYFHEYSASIVEVNSTSSIQVYPPFFKSIEYITNAGLNSSQVYSKFINEGNFTASFYDVLTLAQSSFTQSYAVLDLFNLETNAGQVDKIEVSYKGLNSIGTDFTPIGQFEVKKSNLLVDSASLFFDNEFGIIEKPIGNFRGGLTDFESNWISSSKGSFPITSSVSSRVKDGIKIVQNPLNTGSLEFSLFRPKQFHKVNVKSGTEFEIKADLAFERDSNLKPQLDVYISGSFVKSKLSSERIDFAPIQSASFGQYVGSSFPLLFSVENAGDIQPVFVQRTGIVHIGNIEITSTDQSRIFVPMNLNSGSEISIKVDYLNNAGKKSRYSSILDKIYFTGSKFPGGSSSTPLPGGLISGSEQLTSSFDGRYELKGTGIFSSSAQIGPTGIYSGSGAVRRNTIVSASNIKFETTPNGDGFNSGFMFDGIINNNNINSEYSGNILFFTGKDGDNSRSYLYLTGEESLISLITIDSGSSRKSYLSTTGGGITSTYESGSESFIFTLAGPVCKFADSRTVKNGIEYEGNYTASLMANPSSIPDVRTVRRMFSSASLFSSSQQIGPTGIYSGSGTVPIGTIATIPVGGTFSIAGGGQGLTIDRTTGETAINGGGSTLSLGDTFIDQLVAGGDVRILMDDATGITVTNDITQDGMGYNSDYSSKILSGSLRITDVGSVRKMFSSASLFSSSQQIINNLPAGTVSSSNQIASDISGSINSYSASVNSRLNSLQSVTASYATTASNQFNGNQSISGSLIVQRATGSFSGSFDGQYSSSQQVNYNQITNKINILTPGSGRIFTSDGTNSGSIANKSVTYVSSSIQNRFRINDMVESEQGLSSSFWTTEIKYVTQSVHLCNNANNQVYFNIPIFKNNDDLTVMTSSVHNATYLIQVETMLYGITGSLASPMNTYNWAATTQVRALVNPKDMPSISPLFSNFVAASSSVYSGLGGYGSTFSGKADLNSWFSIPGITYNGGGVMQLRTTLTTTSSFNWTIYAAAVCKVIKHEIRI